MDEKNLERIAEALERIVAYLEKEDSVGVSIQDLDNGTDFGTDFEEEVAPEVSGWLTADAIPSLADALSSFADEQAPDEKKHLD